MYQRFYTLWVAVFCSLLVSSCAKKGSITGGPKDEDPPQFIKAFPPNYSTNFAKNEIRIYFDEYIKLKDAQKQIMISPPMDPMPEISPLGGAGKYVKIKFIDTLLANTTYSINFGESIEDNNEGNANSFFKYVFSTGDALDSLSLKGTVSDALKKAPDSYITVALYEVDESYTDSLVFNEVPRYITNTLETREFQLDNLKEGTYKLIALKDKNRDYKYQPKQDKIGYHEELITLPVTDTTQQLDIRLFKEILDYRAVKPKQLSNNEYLIGYEGDGDAMQVRMLSQTPDDFETRILKDRQKDSLHYWFRPFFEADSLVFEITNKNDYQDTLVGLFREKFKDSLVLKSNVTGNLNFDQELAIKANTPIEAINTELISFVDKDTLDVPFTTQIDTLDNRIKIAFETTEENAYKIELLPEAVTDFIGNVNDTINFSFKTKKKTDYGTIFFTVEAVEKYPILLQLLDEKEKVITTKTVTQEETTTFEYLAPSNYIIRVVMDANANGIWDTGDFLNNIQPETVHYYPDPIEVRANWELKQTFVLED